MDGKFEIAASITGVQGVEVVYPTEFESAEDITALCTAHRLSVSSVNLNVKADPLFRCGAFTHHDASVRKLAVERLVKAMEVARRVGSQLVTCAPLNDGWDYPMEANHICQWEWLVQGIREAASSADDIKLSIEYKRSEPRARVIVDTAAKALLLAQEVGLDNVGVTMDTGHALYAGETPAEAAALLGRAGRLFLVHVNDNYRNWDWDLVPGTVNPWDLVELFLYLDQVGYKGWLVADVFPARLKPTEAFAMTYEMLSYCRNLADSLDWGRLVEMTPQDRFREAFRTLMPQPKRSSD